MLPLGGERRQHCRSSEGVLPLWRATCRPRRLAPSLARRFSSDLSSSRQHQPPSLQVVDVTACCVPVDWLTRACRRAFRLQRHTHACVSSRRENRRLLPLIRRPRRHRDQLAPNYLAEIGSFAVLPARPHSASGPAWFRLWKTQTALSEAHVHTRASNPQRPASPFVVDLVERLQTFDCCHIAPRRSAGRVWRECWSFACPVIHSPELVEPAPLARCLRPRAAIRLVSG